MLWINDKRIEFCGIKYGSNLYFRKQSICDEPGIHVNANVFKKEKEKTGHLGLHKNSHER